MHSGKGKCFKSASGVLPRGRGMMNRGPSFSFSRFTALLTRLREPSQRRSRPVLGGREEGEEALVVSRCDFQNWLQSPSARQGALAWTLAGEEFVRSDRGSRGGQGDRKTQNSR